MGENSIVSDCKHNATGCMGHVTKFLLITHEFFGSSQTFILISTRPHCVQRLNGLLMESYSKPIRIQVLSKISYLAPGSLSYSNAAPLRASSDTSALENTGLAAAFAVRETKVSRREAA